MNAVMTWIFAAIILALLIEGFVHRERLYHYPFLAGAMAFSFILPQAPGVSMDPFLPEGAYAKVCLIGSLALLMLRLGWRENTRPIALFEQTYSEGKLLIAAAVLSTIGSIFYVKISHLPGEVTIGVQMSGVPVMYLFFARLLIYGLTIATLCFARRPSLPAAMIIGVDLVLCLERILVTGKRAEALELVLIGALALFFQRRWIAPRIAAVVCLSFAVLGMSSMADYREITRRNANFDWSLIKQIDVVANFEQTLRSGGPELRNAVQRIDHIDRVQEFDYGAIHWNRLIFNYVPAQIFGSTLKNSLMLPMPSQERDYQPLTGTTETGMVDAFQSFWYFGVVKFLLLAYVMSKLWASAKAGSTTGQILYILSIVPAMHAVSHLTDWVISVWVHMLLFLLPALLYAKVGRHSEPRLETVPAAVADGALTLRGRY